MADHDLVVLGGAADNTLADTLARAAGIASWEELHSLDGEDAIRSRMTACSWHSRIRSRRGRMVYLFAGNSALQLYQMTKRHQSLPTWAVFKGENCGAREGIIASAALTVWQCSDAQCRRCDQPRATVTPVERDVDISHERSLASCSAVLPR